MVWPFKQNLFSSTFTWYYLYLGILQIEIWDSSWLLGTLGSERVKLTQMIWNWSVPLPHQHMHSTIFSIETGPFSLMCYASSNQRLRECVFNWLHYIRQPTLPVPKLSPRRWKSLSPLLSCKWKHGSEVRFSYCFDWELLWKDLTTVNKFSAEDKCPWICADNVFQSVEQRVPNSAIITCLVSQHKSSKTCTKGLKLNFQQSLITYLQEQIHTTNFLWQMKLTCQFNNQRHL